MYIPSPDVVEVPLRFMRPVVVEIVDADIWRVVALVAAAVIEIEPDVEARVTEDMFT